MHPIIPIAGAFFGVAGYMKLRRKRCSSCRRNVRVSGMVGACCKGCADGHKCDSEEEDEEESYVAGQRRSRYKHRRRRF